MQQVKLLCHACGKNVDWSVQRPFAHKCPQCSEPLEGQFVLDAGELALIWRVKQSPARQTRFSLLGRKFSRRMAAATGRFKAGKCPNCRSDIYLPENFAVHVLCESCGVLPSEKTPIFEIFEAVSQAQEPAPAFSPKEVMARESEENHQAIDKPGTYSPFLNRWIKLFTMSDVPVLYRIPIMLFFLGVIGAFIGVIVLFFVKIFR